MIASNPFTKRDARLGAEVGAENVEVITRLIKAGRDYPPIISGVGVGMVESVRAIFLRKTDLEPVRVGKQ